jgi:WD40 repeat protein
MIRGAGLFALSLVCSLFSVPVTHAATVDRAPRAAWLRSYQGLLRQAHRNLTPPRFAELARGEAFEPQDLAEKSAWSAFQKLGLALHEYSGPETETGVRKEARDFAERLAEQARRSEDRAQRVDRSERRRNAWPTRLGAPASELAELIVLPDGDTLAYIAPGPVRMEPRYHPELWSLKQNRLRATYAELPNQRAPVQTAHVAGSNSLVAALYDGGTVSWDLNQLTAAPRTIRSKGGAQGYQKLAVSLDGRTSVYQRTKRKLVVRIEGRPRREWSPPHAAEPAFAHTAFALAHDGNTLAIALGSGALELWDLSEVRAGRSPLAPRARLERSGVPYDKIQLSKDGSRLAAATEYTPEMTLFSLKDPGGPIQALVTIKGSDSFSALAFSSQGKLLAAGGQGGKIQIYDAQTGRLQTIIQDPVGEEVKHLAFDPFDRYLIGGITQVKTYEYRVFKWTLAELAKQGEITSEHLSATRIPSSLTHTPPRLGQTVDRSLHGILSSARQKLEPARFAALVQSLRVVDDRLEVGASPEHADSGDNDFRLGLRQVALASTRLEGASDRAEFAGLARETITAMLEATGQSVARVRRVEERERPVGLRTQIPLSHPEEFASDFVFLQDSRYLLALASDQMAGNPRITVFDTRSWREHTVRLPRSLKGPHSFVRGADGRLGMLDRRFRASILETDQVSRDGGPLRTSPLSSIFDEIQPESWRIASDGRTLLVWLRGGRIRLFDTARGWEEISAPAPLSEGIGAVDFSADGRSLAFSTTVERAGKTQKRVHVYERDAAQAWKLVREVESEGTPFVVKFTPDSKHLLLMLDATDKLQIWDTGNWQALARVVQATANTGVGFLPASGDLVFVRDREIVLADPAGLRPERAIRAKHRQHDLAVDPTGTFVIARDSETDAPSAYLLKQLAFDGEVIESAEAP